MYKITEGDERRLLEMFGNEYCQLITDSSNWLGEQEWAENWDYHDVLDFHISLVQKANRNKGKLNGSSVQE